MSTAPGWREGSRSRRSSVSTIRASGSAAMSVSIAKRRPACARGGAAPASACGQPRRAHLRWELVATDAVIAVVVSDVTGRSSRLSSGSLQARDPPCRPVTGRRVSVAAADRTSG
jgi:hypothetical protein